MPVDNVSDFECYDAFVINFTASLVCTFSIGNNDGQTVGFGVSTLTKNFTFTKGSNTAGTFDEHVSYTVDGGTPTINSAPSHVTFGGQFNGAPDLSEAVSPRELQGFEYTYTIGITEPSTMGGADGFAGTRLSVVVTLGFEST